MRAVPQLLRTKPDPELEDFLDSAYEECEASGDRIPPSLLPSEPAETHSREQLRGAEDVADMTAEEALTKLDDVCKDVFTTLRQERRAFDATTSTSSRHR